MSVTTSPQQESLARPGKRKDDATEGESLFTQRSRQNAAQPAWTLFAMDIFAQAAWACAQPGPSGWRENQTLILERASVHFFPQGASRQDKRLNSK